MNQNIQSGEYDSIIKKIQQKRNVVVVLTIIAFLITISVCSPLYISFFDETIIDYKGISPIITVLLAVLVIFFGLIAYAVVSVPLITSMDIECDPQKHLTLNSILNKEKNKDHIYAVDFLYMGNFEVALNYANQMILNNKPDIMLTGLFNKARCEFFLGDFDSLKVTVMQYKNSLNSMKKIKPKVKDVYKKMQKTMNLLTAISEEDTVGISNLRSVEAWNNSKATQGYINYLKGIAAYILKDKDEAIYRFMSVKENCQKTFLFKNAEEYLSKLNTDI